MRTADESLDDVLREVKRLAILERLVGIRRLMRNIFVLVPVNTRCRTLS